MFARASLRTLNLVLLFFAALGFVSVPLGKRTAWEHTRAILATDAAEEARTELGIAARRLRDSVLEAWQSDEGAVPNAHFAHGASVYAVPMSRIPAPAASAPRGNRFVRTSSSSSGASVRTE